MGQEATWVGSSQNGCKSAQATSHDLGPPNGGLVREIPPYLKSRLVKYYSIWPDVSA